MQQWSHNKNGMMLLMILTLKRLPVATTTTTPTPQEEAIICDVQRILGRLVGKASQLPFENNIYNDLHITS